MTNVDNPIHGDRNSLVRQLAVLRPELAAEGVRHLAIFGSRARGDFRVGSDLDLLLDVAPDGHFSLLDLVGVEHLVADALGIRANVFLRRSLDRDFMRTISADLVQVF